jgi:glutathione S-transferase
MQLFFSTNSPYARKCRIVALEKGLQNRIEFINVNPLEDPPALRAVNPLGTVPALMTDDGLHLCESPVICEYLDLLDGSPSFHPKDEARICVLAMAALADGIMDAAVSCVLENRKLQKSAEWIQRKEAAALRAIAKFADASIQSAPLSMGTINLAVALAYVSFRLPHLNWRREHPALAVWLDEMNKRPSFMATRPQA